MNRLFKDYERFIGSQFNIVHIHSILVVLGDVGTLDVFSDGASTSFSIS